MWYWILNFIVAIWVFDDARKRKMEQPLAWAVGSVVLMIVFLPFYFAKRNLKAGETREGGTAWNWLKSFSLFWTLTMFLAGIAGMFSAGQLVNSAGSQAEQAGAAIGTFLGLGKIAGIWFFVISGALLLGLMLKKSSQIEKGPTGALSNLQNENLEWR